MANADKRAGRAAWLLPLAWLAIADAQAQVVTSTGLSTYGGASGSRYFVPGETAPTPAAPVPAATAPAAARPAAPAVAAPVVTTPVAAPSVTTTPVTTPPVSSTPAAAATALPPAPPVKAAPAPATAQPAATTVPAAAAVAPASPPQPAAPYVPYVPAVIQAELPMPGMSAGPAGQQSIGAPTTATPVVGGIDNTAPATQFLAGVRTRVTVTDNGNVAPAGQNKHDTIGEINPYLSGVVNRPTEKGAIYYGLRGVVRANDTAPNELRHDLRALGDLSLGSPRLRLSGSALVMDANQSPFQQTVDPALTAPGNRVLYRRFDLSPYYVGQLGSVADYQLRYRFVTSNDLIPGVRSTDQAVSAWVRSADNFNTVGWDVSGQANRRSFENDFVYNYSVFAATGYLPLGPDARIGASANYSRVDIVVNDRGRNEGWGPGMAFDWIPSDRTAMNITAARQFYGNTGSIKLVHRAPTWTIGLNAQRALLTSTDSGLVYLDPARQFGTLRMGASSNPVVDDLIRQSLLNPTGFLMAAAPAGSALVMDSRVTALFGYTGQRNSVLFSGFAVTRDLLSLTPEAIAGLPASATGVLVDQRGYGLTLSHSTSPSTAVYLRTVLGDSRTSGATQVSRLTSYAVGLRSMLTPQLVGLAEIRHTQQRNKGLAIGDYDENSVAMALDYRF